MAERLLILACGALVRDIERLRRTRGWQHVDVRGIDARLHNAPARIPDTLRARIREYRPHYRHIFVAYADCGTAGGIDAVLREEGIERLDGAHCYELFAGRERFASLAAHEPGTFYLTDFLARHFERLVIIPLGLDRHPGLRDAYFGNYRRLVFLSQTDDATLLARARAAARALGLAFEHVPCGDGELATGLDGARLRRDIHEENRRLLA